MRDNRKYIFISLGICVFVMVLGAIYFVTRNSETDENAVTRYEWIEMLTGQMGLQEYTAETPYFSDVVPGDPYFSCIQAAAEQEIIEKDTGFKGEDFATGQFIALTAMKTIGETKFRISFGIEDKITDDTYMAFALEHGLVEEEKLKKGITREECDQVLETLKNLYFSEFWRDDYSSVVYQDGVIELSPEDVLQSDIDGSKITVTDNVIQACKEGSVIVFTQKNTNLKLARKIIGINSEGTLMLDTVELEEVVETLTVSDITEVTFDDIVNYYGLDENISVSNNLVSQQNDTNFANVINTAVFSGSVNSKGYALSVSTQGEDKDRKIVVQITENMTGIKWTLPISEKVKREDDYAAEINIDKIYIGGQVDYSFVGGLKYAEAAVDVHATLKSEIKAEVEKKILLFKTPVPLGNGIIGADVSIFLILSVDGSISFEAELPIEASVSYEKNKGFRNFKQHIALEDPMIEVNCNANAGLRFEPVLMVLGCPNVMDIEVDIGVTAGAKVITQPNSQICADISISFPVMTISVCGDDDVDTIIGKWGLSAEWETISSDDAWIKKGLHYELVSGKRAQFVKECTYEKQEENPTDTVQQSQKKASSSYQIPEFKLVSDYEGPIDLWINAPFEDAGEYYIVKGNLQIPYAVLPRDFNKLHSGDQFTVIDKEFILGDRLETEDFPAKIYPVYCVDDDSTYYIQTKVALEYGSLYRESYYPICRSIPDYDAISESMEILTSDLGVHEINIAKDTYITSLTAMNNYTDTLIAVEVSGLSDEEIRALGEERRQKGLEKFAHTAEECFKNHVLFDDWLDIANFSSVYGELEFPIHCYTAFDENGEIDIIVWDSFD